MTFKNPDYSGWIHWIKSKIWNLRVSPGKQPSFWYARNSRSFMVPTILLSRWRIRIFRFFYIFSSCFRVFPKKYTINWNNLLLFTTNEQLKVIVVNQKQFFILSLDGITKWRSCISAAWFHPETDGKCAPAGHVPHLGIIGHFLFWKTKGKIFKW